MEKITVIDERQSTVVKSNILVQEARYSLSVVQQRILLYLISKIAPGSTEFAPIELNVLEFCEIAGIKGKKYAAIKEEVKKLADSSFWIESQGKEVLKRWINSETPPQIIQRSGTITLCLSNSLREYLLELRSHFTQYQLEWVLAFKRKYSIRLYEYLCSRHYNTLEPYVFQITLANLKEVLGTEEHYSRFNKFNEKVLQPAAAEINEFSDKKIIYKPIKKGTTVVSIEFTVIHKEALEALETEHRINKKLGLPDGQLTLWEEISSR